MSESNAELTRIAVERLAAELSAQQPAPQPPAAPMFVTVHAVKVPKGWLQLLVEEGTPTVTLADLANLLRWTADSLDGHRVPMDYELGQKWNDGIHLEWLSDNPE